jgi:superfamily II DNA/RNA helicase
MGGCLLSSSLFITLLLGAASPSEALMGPGIVRHGSSIPVQSLAHHYYGETTTPSIMVLSMSTTDDVSSSSTATSPSPSFDELGLCKEAISAIRSQPDWVIPTPIQQLIIPKIALPLQQPLRRTTGSKEEEVTTTTAISTTTLTTAPSVWCEAPTGSGKTAAYALPLLHNLLQQQAAAVAAAAATATTNKKRRSGRITSLILCPTRELAAQIGMVVSQLANNMNNPYQKKQSQKKRETAAATSTTTVTKKGGRNDRSFSKSASSWKSQAPVSAAASSSSSSSSNNNGWNIMTIYGGIPLEPQIAQLADCARFGQTIDVLIATPGRLVDVLTYYSKEHGDSSAQDAAFERRVLAALGESSNQDSSLSLEQLQELQLDRGMSSSTTGNGGRPSLDDGRSQLINLLKDLQYFIVDEADRLLGKAFETELENVLDLMPHKVPTWLFSATYPKHMEPRIDAIWQRIMGKEEDATIPTAPILRLSCATSDRVIVSNSVSNRSRRASVEDDDHNNNNNDDSSNQIQQPGDEDISSTLSHKTNLDRSPRSSSSDQDAVFIGPASTIGLRTIRLERPARTQALRQLLKENHKEWDRVLVFVATRYAAEHVSRKLTKAGIASSELHGKLDQDARQRRLHELKRGTIRVLIATDVASRGLDIVGLPVVVNYDLPRSTADFVHRIGRTGRAGRFGTAISFCTPDSEAHLDLIEARHLIEPVEREVLVGLEPDEDKWQITAESARISPEGTLHSDLGLAHDRMFGGIKGRRKSKKDKLRESAARKQQQQQQKQPQNK